MKNSCVGFLLLATVMVGIASAGPDNIVGHFARVYDKAHLAEHPDQMVMAVKLSITAEKPNNLALEPWNR
jgi:hypothetical protein